MAQPLTDARFVPSAADARKLGVCHAEVAFVGRSNVGKSSLLNALANQKQLADSEAAARNAKDGNAAATLGLALAGAGANERALALMELGQTKGGLRRPDDALLHLGMVQVRLGRLDEALKSFAAVQGADGSADLARLWSLHVRGNLKKK